MPNYYFTTVVQQTIPNADMSPLERLLLTHIFEWEQDDDGLYFFASEGSCDMICVSRHELEAAISGSEAYKSSVISVVNDGLAETPESESDIELDFSMTSWEPIFQDIVRRSSTLTQITAMTAFTCSKMRPDGFGGMAILITADVILAEYNLTLIASRACLIAKDGLLKRLANEGRLQIREIRFTVTAARQHYSFERC